MTTDTFLTAEERAYILRCICLARAEEVPGLIDDIVLALREEPWTQSLFETLLSDMYDSESLWVGSRTARFLYRQYLLPTEPALVFGGAIALAKNALNPRLGFDDGRSHVRFRYDTIHHEVGWWAAGEYELLKGLPFSMR